MALAELQEPVLQLTVATQNVDVLRVALAWPAHLVWLAKSLQEFERSDLAVPIVDELATIPLDLSAREHGYQKLQMNSLGA